MTIRFLYSIKLSMNPSACLHKKISELQLEKTYELIHPTSPIHKLDI